MTPEAIIKDELARACKHKKQDHVASENQLVATEIEKHNTPSKCVQNNKNEIKLKGSCYLATKSNLDEIDVNIVVCYALVCKETLFSVEDTPIFLPPDITKLLQE
jgi:hypothetical protein